MAEPEKKPNITGSFNPPRSSFSGKLGSAANSKPMAPFIPRQPPNLQTMQKLHGLITSGGNDTFATNKVPPACLTEITFGPQSHEEIRAQSCLEVYANKLWTSTFPFEPIQHGLMDPKMGVNMRRKDCATCGKPQELCLGHFGHLQLYYPVYHMGYFKNVFQIMQCVCENCSRVLLKGPQRLAFLNRATKPVTLPLKKDLRKKIVDLCKKQKLCPYCGTVQTNIKRFGYYRMVMDVLRPSTTQRKLLPNLVHLAETATESGSGEFLRVDLGTAKILLNPVYTQKVLRMIPVQDWPLLLCGKTAPEDLLMSSIQVPPVPIRPTVMQENEGTANQDDITVAISGVLAFCQILQEKIDKDPLRTHMENWENMQWKCNQILNGNAKDPGSTVVAAGMSKPHKGFEQRLKGKHGRFRGTLMANG